MDAQNNSIPHVQNQDDMQRLRRAIRASYDNAQRLVLLQVVFAVVVPVVAAVVGLAAPDAKAYTAALAFILTVLDVAVLDRRQKALLKRGALFGEAFDTKVLQLPWDSFTVGERPQPEDVRAAESTFERRKTKADLLDWYPPAVGALPLHLARLICLRANLSYDAAQRRGYATTVLWIAHILVVVVLVVALLVVKDLQVDDLILILAPTVPTLSWAWREAHRQRDTATAQEAHIKQARKVWDDAVADECGPDHCELRAREFQSATYLRRASAPMILPGVYKSRRAELEDQMTSAANDFVAEYHDALAKRPVA